MKQVRATVKYVRISALKMRMLRPLIRGKSLVQAKSVLQFTPRKGARITMRLLSSAQANAVNTHNLDEKSLIVQDLMVDQGPFLKRYWPRSRGRAEMIRRPTCHASIVLKGNELKTAVTETKPVKTKAETETKPSKKQ